jgi:ATP-dependent Clp protease ATP-binding subunit ClpA
VFERFTNHARRVVVYAQEEARLLNHDYIGTEHILLGLIREQDGLGYRLLGEVGADPDRVRQLTLARTNSAREVEGEETQTHTRLGISLGSLSAIESRLVRIERRLGIEFPAAISDLSRRLNEVRRDKAAAIESQEFDRAAQLRDLEHRLAAARVAALREMPDPDEVTPIEHELANARTEIERLTGLLRSHGIDPGEPEPGHPPAAAEG